MGYSELRPVCFEAFYNELNELRTAEITKGRFHQWGKAYLQNDEEITIAIVEGQDGKVYRVPSDYLSFIDTRFHKIVDEILEKPTHPHL